MPLDRALDRAVHRPCGRDHQDGGDAKAEQRGEAVRHADRPDHPECEEIEDREVVPIGGERVAQRRDRPARALGRPEMRLHRAALLQHDHHQEEVHHERHQLHEGKMEARVEAEEEGDLGGGVAEDADADDAPRPEHRVARRVVARRQEPERWAGGTHQHPHGGEQDPRDDIGVGDGEDHELGDRAGAEAGAEKPVGDGGEDDHGHEIEQKREDGEPGAAEVPRRLVPAPVLRLARLGARLPLGRAGRGPRGLAVAAAGSAASAAGPGERGERGAGPGERADRQPLRRQPRCRNHREPPGHGKQHLVEVAIVENARDPDRKEGKGDDRPDRAADCEACRLEAAGKPDQHLSAEAVRLERHGGRGRAGGGRGGMRRRRGLACR